MFGKDIDQITKILESHNIVISQATSIEQIVQENKISTFEVVDMIVEKR